MQRQAEDQAQSTSITGSVTCGITGGELSAAEESRDGERSGFHRINRVFADRICRRRQSAIEIRLPGSRSIGLAEAFNLLIKNSLNVLNESKGRSEFVEVDAVAFDEFPDLRFRPRAVLQPGVEFGDPSVFEQQLGDEKAEPRPI